MHSTDDMDDGYLGSGKILRNSINKYGKENHIREIYGDFLPDRESLRLREAEIIDNHRLMDPKCMNNKLGGEGGSFPGINHGLKRNMSSETREKIGKIWRGRKQTTEHIQKRIESRRNTGHFGLSEESRKKISDTLQGHVSWNKGKSFSDETRQKISAALKGHVPWNKGKRKGA